MSRSSEKLLSEVMAIAHQELASIGMRKRGGQIFTFQRDEPFIGWLGLNRAIDRASGRIAFNPVVGVRYQVLEVLLASLLNEPFHEYIPATVATSIGYLMPEKSYTEWIFEEGAENELEVKKLVKAVREYGFAFIEANTTIGALIDTMKANVGIPEQLTYRLPVAYYLNNQATAAREYLQKRVVGLNDRKDVAAQAYRKFATAFMEKLR